MLRKLKTSKFWLSLIRDGLILLAIVFAFNLYQTRNTSAQLPDSPMQLMSGQLVNLKQMAKTSPVIIYFWGSWCPICSFTSSTMTEMAKNYQVLSVALSSGDNQQVQEYLAKNKYHFPVVNDPDGFISQQWGVSATPTLFIINSKGEISSVVTGITSAWSLKIRLWLTA